MGKNVLVAQSGGPTCVINNSLRGIVETCRAYSEKFGTVYGGWHGVEGILQEELLDLSAQPDDEIALLRTSPAAGRATPTPRWPGSSIWTYRRWRRRWRRRPTRKTPPM